MKEAKYMRDASLRDWTEKLDKYENHMEKKLCAQVSKDYIKWHGHFLETFANLSGSVLDVGCGPFYVYFKDFLKENKVKYVGCDPLDCSHLAKFPFVQCRGEDLQFDDSSFDNVMILGVLDHVINPYKTLLEAKRVLKIDGRLLIAQSISGSVRELKTKIDFMSKTGLTKIYKFVLKKFMDFLIESEYSMNHTFSFSRQNLCKLVEKCGFKITYVGCGFFKGQIYLCAEKTK